MPPSCLFHVRLPLPPSHRLSRLPVWISRILPSVPSQCALSTEGVLEGLSASHCAVWGHAIEFGHSWAGAAGHTCQALVSKVLWAGCVCQGVRLSGEPRSLAQEPGQPGLCPGDLHCVSKEGRPMGPLFCFCEGRPRAISSFLTGTRASPTPVGFDAFSRLSGYKVCEAVHGNRTFAVK